MGCGKAVGTQHHRFSRREATDDTRKVVDEANPRVCKRFHDGEGCQLSDSGIVDHPHKNLMQEKQIGLQRRADKAGDVGPPQDEHSIGKCYCDGSGKGRGTCNGYDRSVVQMSDDGGEPNLVKAKFGSASGSRTDLTSARCDIFLGVNQHVVAAVARGNGLLPVGFRPPSRQRLVRGEKEAEC